MDQREVVKSQNLPAPIGVAPNGCLVGKTVGVRKKKKIGGVMIDVGVIE